MKHWPYLHTGWSWTLLAQKYMASELIAWVVLPPTIMVQYCAGKSYSTVGGSPSWKL